MQEFMIRLECTVFQLPGCFCCVQHHQCSKHVCLYKHFRILDASVHMALRRKMNHSLDIIFFEQCVDRLTVTDICLYKGIIRSVFNVFQVLKISRISQFVYINNLNFVTIFFEHIMDIVGADKSRSSGYQVSTHFNSSVLPFFGYCLVYYSIIAMKKQRSKHLIILLREYCRLHRYILLPASLALKPRVLSLPQFLPLLISSL